MAGPGERIIWIQRKYLFLLFVSGLDHRAPIRLWGFTALFTDCWLKKSSFQRHLRGASDGRLFFDSQHRALLKHPGILATFVHLHEFKNNWLPCNTMTTVWPQVRNLGGV